MHPIRCIIVRSITYFYARHAPIILTHHTTGQPKKTEKVAITLISNENHLPCTETIYGKVCTVSAVPSNIKKSSNNFMPELGAALGPSSSEPAVQFVKDQSDYVRDLCRITKLWHQSIAYFEFISGRSYLFECIAIR